MSIADGINGTRYTQYAPYLALFLFLFSIYLLSYTPRINSSDGLAMFSTAESIVRRGALDIEQIRWMDLQQGTFGLDGLLYSRKGIGVPIGMLPLAWLGLVVPGWGMVGVSLLFNAIVTALTAVLILVYLKALGFTRRVGLIVALTFGLTTLAWPYAKSLFSDPLSGLLLLGAAYALLKFSRGAGGQRGGGEEFFTPAPLLPCSSALIYPLLAGLLLGWNIATRYAEAVFVPVFGLLLLYYLWIRRPWSWQHFLPPLVAFSLPLLVIGLALTAFNLSRYGDAFNTGYLPNETFSGILWQGVLGQLLSPGRGLLFYCPVFLLSLVGLWLLLRRHPAQVLVALSVILIHLLLYGKWFMWHGGYAWGPRFMIPTLPFWAIFLAPLVKRAFSNKVLSGKTNLTILQPSTLHLIFVTLALLGGLAQLISVLIDFAPFQNSFLEAGLPLFHPQTFFDPQYSPFIAAWPFITWDKLDLAWAWQGEIKGWLLAALVVNIVITWVNLRICEFANGRIGNQNTGITWRWGALQVLTIMTTVSATIFLLNHTHNLPAQSLQQAVAALNEGVGSEDAIITNDPEIALPFAELYKGRAAVLGLQSGNFPLPQPITQRVNVLIQQHRQLWWLPDQRPAEQSGVEQLLMASGFRARNDDFAGQRLTLFAFPTEFSSHLRLIEAKFEGDITLVKAAIPLEVTSGTALPIELHWQTQTSLKQDYHVFIHLVKGGQTLSQADGQPALWTRPTTTWQVGQTVVDRHGLWLPAGVSPGAYQLSVGLYQPGDGRRIPLTTGQDGVQFEVTIK